MVVRITSGGYTCHNLHLWVVRPHCAHQLCEGREDVGYVLVLLNDVVGAEVHGDDIRGVGLQPAVQLVLVRNVDGKEARVAFVVTVVLGVFAVVLGLSRAHEVHRGPLRTLQFFPEKRAPANDLGDGVTKGHVAERGILGRDGAQERQDSKEAQGYHDDKLFDAALSTRVDKGGIRPLSSLYTSSP